MPDKNSLKQDLEEICAEITPENASGIQKGFSKLWKKYVTENGYDEFAEKTLIDGHLCNSINYWKDIWKEQEQGDDFFERFLSGKKIQNKGKGTRIVLLGALSICINDFETAGKFIGRILQLLEKNLPQKSDVNLKEFGERFLKRIKVRELDIQKLGAPSKKVLAFFKEVRKIYPDDKQETENREKLDFVISLLSGSKKQKKKDSLPEKKAEKKEDVAAGSDDQSQNEELQKLKNKYRVLSEAKKRLDEDMVKYQTWFKEKRAEWMEEEKNYKSQITALQNSLNNRRLEVEEKKTEIQDLKTQTEQLSAELEQKESVIQEKDQSIRILKEARDDRYEEKMKSIQDRLAMYYGAFQNCRDKQMSEDLGYVMRGYLNDVFEIIMDNEMDLNQQ